MATVAPWQAADYFINQYGRVPTADEIIATQTQLQQAAPAPAPAPAPSAGIASIPFTLPTRTSSNPSLAGQVIGPVNPATGPQYYPSGDMSLKIDPAAVARAQAEADRIAAEAAAKAKADADAAAARARAEAGAATTQKKGLDAPALNRAEILELYRGIGMASPKDADVNFWLDYSQNNPDVINSANPRNQVINAFKAAAQGYGLNVARDFGQFDRNIARPTIFAPEGQVLSPLQFATPQRGIQALRGPAYMSSLLEMPAGATNITSSFGGPQVSAAPAGVSAIPQPVRRQGPFALETGVSFGPLTVSPEAIARAEAAAASAASNANLNTRTNTPSLLNYGGGDSGGPTGPGGTPGQAVDAATSVAAAIANALGISPGLNDEGAPISGISEAGIAGVAGDGGAGASGAATGDSGGVSSGEGIRSGGLIGYQEGGVPKLSAREAGSRFDVSEYIDPETGRFYINEFQRDVVFNPELREAERVERIRLQQDPEAAQEAIRLARNRRMANLFDTRQRMAQGGLASVAENLADRGRGGDSMLVHMSPEEVAGLRGLAMQMGSDLTINPQTGLPEAFSLKKIFRAVAPMLPFLIPGVGTALSAFGAKFGLGALASKSIAAGLIGGFTAPGKGFNFKEGLKTGIMAYGGGKLMEGLQAAGQMGGTAPSTGPISSGSGGVSIGMEPSLYATGAPPATAMGPAGAEIASSVPSTAPVMEPAIDIRSLQSSGPALSDPFPTAPPPSTGPNVSVQGVEDAARGVKNIFTGGPEASAAFTEAAGVTPTTALTLGTTGYGLMEGDAEREAFKTAQAAKAREEEEERKRYIDIFRRTMPMAAGGGMVAFADGGMPTFEYGGTTAPTGEPRMVKGAGDGMSDNVPANIEGVQEARLANDEFVVPADVVADIGNGSSSAGAKKLYAMMDRIRKARHGTTEQPPEIDAERLMPA